MKMMNKMEGDVSFTFPKWLTDIELSSSVFDGNFMESQPTAEDGIAVTDMNLQLPSTMYNETEGDVSFTFPNWPGTANLKADKSLLALHSSVFKAMFDGNFVESKQTVEEGIAVTDVNPDVFQTMLEFIYTGKLRANELDSDFICRTMIVANKYDVRQLQKKCSEVLIKGLSDGDAVYLFQLAQFISDKELEQAGKDFIQKNFQQVLRCEQFLDLTYENLHFFLTDPKTCLDNELLLYASLVKWSEAECNRRGYCVTRNNQRRVLGTLLRLVQFSKIEAAGVSLHLILGGILTVDEIPLLSRNTSPTSGLTVDSTQSDVKADVPTSAILRSPVDVTYFAHGTRQLQEFKIKLLSRVESRLKVSRPVAVIGFGLVGPRKGYLYSEIIGDFYIESVQKNYLRRQTKCVKNLWVQEANDRIFISFDEAVPLYPDVDYLLVFNLKNTQYYFPSNSRHEPATMEAVIFGDEIVTFNFNSSVIPNEISFKALDTY